MAGLFDGENHTKNLVLCGAKYSNVFTEIFRNLSEEKLKALAVSGIMTEFKYFWLS